MTVRKVFRYIMLLFLSLITLSGIVGFFNSAAHYVKPEIYMESQTEYINNNCQPYPITPYQHYMHIANQPSTLEERNHDLIEENTPEARDKIKIAPDTPDASAGARPSYIRPHHNCSDVELMIMYDNIKDHREDQARDEAFRKMITYASLIIAPGTLCVFLFRRK